MKEAPMKDPMKEWSTFAGMPTAPAIPALAEKQADVLRKTQDELIDEVQQVADRWCERRHKMVEAMFDLSLTSLHNPGQLGTADAWMRWYHGALQRLSEDASDQMELAVTVAKCCGNDILMLASSTERSQAKTLASRRGEREFTKSRSSRR
jgi:hypothetical protein